MRLQEEIRKIQQQRSGNSQGVTPVATQQPVQPVQPVQQQEPEVSPSTGAVTPEVSSPASGSYMDVIRQYMPKPDYEQEKKAARRSQMGAFISDLANVVGKAGASAGGAWLIQPTQFRTPAAQQQYNNVIQRERAAYMDYGGRLANAAIKDMEAKKAAEALKAKRDWEAQQAQIEAEKDKRDFEYKKEKDQRDFDYKKQKDQRDYELSVKNAERDYELGKISAKQRDEQIKIAKEANQIRREKQGTGTGKTIYLQDQSGQKRPVSLSKDKADNVLGYVARRIKGEIGGNEALQQDYDMLMSQYSSADSNTKLQAVVNLLGTEFPGLYEEVTQLIGENQGDSEEDFEQYREGGEKQSTALPPVFDYFK